MIQKPETIQKKNSAEIETLRNRLMKLGDRLKIPMPEDKKLSGTDTAATQRLKEDFCCCKTVDLQEQRYTILLNKNLKCVPEFVKNFSPVGSIIHA